MMAREVVQVAVVAKKKRSDKELRWSVRRKTDAVMRLLRGEDLDVVARELRVEAHRLAAWRDEFMAGGAEALKARPVDPTDRKLREAERQIGRLTMGPRGAGMRRDEERVLLTFVWVPSGGRRPIPSAGELGDGAW
jgi:hypothetical protein